MIVLIGAGGHGKVIADILLKTVQRKIIFYDVNPSTDKIYDCEVFSEMPKKISSYDVIVCIGNNSLRKKNVMRLEGPFAKAIHPFSYIGNNVDIGEGTVVMAGSVINPFVKIGKHCIVNTSASIDHDCKIDDFVHVSPNATLCGGVSIGEGTHIGAGATIIPGISIGRWVTIGAGSVIIQNIADFSTVVGNPGRVIKNQKIDYDYE
jgi:acetyltransferase EpsM